MKISFEFTGIDEARTKINKFIESTKTNVAKVLSDFADGDDYSISNFMRSNMQSIVYDAYNPKIYERKYLAGGLLGAVVSKADGLEATVYIDGDKLTDSTGKTKDGKMANGAPYFWRVLGGHGRYPYDYPAEDAAFLKPRDFFSPTVAMVKEEMNNGQFKSQVIAAINAAKRV